MIMRHILIGLVSSFLAILVCLYLIVPIWWIFTTYFIAGALGVLASAAIAYIRDNNGSH